MESECHRLLPSGTASGARAAGSLPCSGSGSLQLEVALLRPLKHPGPESRLGPGFKLDSVDIHVRHWRQLSAQSVAQHCQRCLQASTGIRRGPQQPAPASSGSGACSMPGQKKPEPAAFPTS